MMASLALFKELEVKSTECWSCSNLVEAEFSDFGLSNANSDRLDNMKAMIEPLITAQQLKSKRIEQELWTLTLKKIESYFRGFPERIKGNITSSKPATLHEAINMARELVKQAV
ncbi:hypothetical protein Tco_0072504 [Tanacetum coccineum]